MNEPNSFIVNGKLFILKNGNKKDISIEISKAITDIKEFCSKKGIILKEIIIETKDDLFIDYENQFMNVPIPHVSVFVCRDCQKDIMDGFFFMTDFYCNKKCCLNRYKKLGIDIEETINNIIL